MQKLHKGFTLCCICQTLLSFINTFKFSSLTMTVYCESLKFAKSANKLSLQLIVKSIADTSSTPSESELDITITGPGVHHEQSNSSLTSTST